MMTNRWIAIWAMSALVCAVATQSSAQQVPAPPGVIRINVNLVQVDAVVTDNKGKAVTDLKAEDFEVLQDGKPQVITNLAFIDVKDSAVRASVIRPAAQPRGGPPVPPPPPPAFRPQQIRRTVALVVDDLGLSFDSIVRVRQALTKWVDTDMQPGDLVAVIGTSAGMGALQQFTGDKRLLRSAIERGTTGRVGISSFAALEDAGAAGSIDTTAFNQELEQTYSVGSMGAIQYVVQGLRDLPGRKRLILFSESMRLTFPDVRSQLVEERLRRLSDAANRSSVVIYAIDPRGVAYIGLTAEDRTSGMSPQQIAGAFSQRSALLINSQEGMFSHSDKEGSYLNALLYFAAGNLTFMQDPHGLRTAMVDIAGVTFDADGRQVDGTDKTWRFRVTQTNYQEILKKGLVYSMHVPVKTAGAYQMRVVLRDYTTGELGSATQFVEVPDVKKGRLALSGILLAADQPTQGAGDSAEGQLAGEDPNVTAAVRVFKPGNPIVYVYETLNAHMDAGKKLQLVVQMRLFRDGQQVYAGPPSAMNSESQQNPQHLVGIGCVSWGRRLRATICCRWSSQIN